MQESRSDIALAALESASPLARPFIYIASLRRTGSTVLAEALTSPRLSFIFLEPGLCRNRFRLKDHDAQRFQELGIDLTAMREAWLANRPARRRARPGASSTCDALRRHVLDAFRDDFLPQFARRFQQVGVKEIRHESWRRYLETFPGMKVIITGRDPRDIYLSLYHRQSRGEGSWKGEYTPKAVADNLLEQFALQREIDAATDALRMRYEDLCTDPTAFERIRRHVDSPLPQVGEIGIFLSGAKGRRVEEDTIHGGQITDKRIARWREEPDPRLVDEAHECFRLMPEYTEFWGYEA